VNRQTFVHERSRAKYLIARGQNSEYWLGYCYGLEALMGEVPAMTCEQTSAWQDGYTDAMILGGRRRGRPRVDERTSVFSCRIPDSSAARLDKAKRKSIKKIIIDELKGGK